LLSPRGNRFTKEVISPWHGPYRIVFKRDTDVEVNKMYFPQEGKIQVYQSRIKPCPPNFPSGYYWYGTCRKSAGRPPKSCGPDKKSTKKSVESCDKPVQDALLQVVTQQRIVGNPLLKRRSQCKATTI